MKRLYWIAMALAVASPPAVNAADSCGDTFSECREDCTLEFGGSIRDSVKAQHIKCMKKCTKKFNLCDERQRETKAGKLDDGALMAPEEAKKKPREATSPIQPSPKSEPSPSTHAKPKPAEEAPSPKPVQVPDENDTDGFDDLRHH